MGFKFFVLGFLVGVFENVFQKHVFCVWVFPFAICFSFKFWVWVFGFLSFLFFLIFFSF